MKDMNFRTPGQAAADVPHIIASEGVPSANTTELLGVQLVIDEPSRIPFQIEGRGLSQNIARAEILSLCGLTPVDSYQRRFASKLAVYQDEGCVQWGNYGDRIRYQFADLLRELELPVSRQGVLTIFDGNRDLAYGGLDTPCTLSLQFLIREGLLHMITTMRSNDAFLGLPYDLMQFSAIMMMVAECMNVGVGTHVHQAGSMHVYDRDRKKLSICRDSFELFPDDEMRWGWDEEGRIIQFCQDSAQGGRTESSPEPFVQWLGDGGRT